MSQKMLIDASLPGETRVVIVKDKRIEEFDYEQSHRVPIKGNIYLAKVSRVEPSLQAAFIEYGGNRHGFLAFSEIHPDYFRIPVDDIRHHEEEEDYHDDDNDDDDDEEQTSDSVMREVRARSRRLKRLYKIQEVIKRGQIIVVQAVKEERGNKGAAMSSYISLAGRYCVLMPNTDRGGGISRKIADAKDRKELKEIITELALPEGMGLIVRTAGKGQGRSEIRRDFTYIANLWDEIRELTLKSTAPALIYEEGNLFKRCMRDLYNKNISEIIVAGQQGFQACRSLMKTLMPSHVKKITEYKDNIPLFVKYDVEEGLKTISDISVPLSSGGCLVINQTEALVAIDINSGKAIRERHIEETALQTNLEASEEIARQLKLRDLAGLVVIDFITMEDRRNNKSVENKLRDHLKSDRARIQLGRISIFGLLELSRQRIRPSFLESIHRRCPACEGGGYVPSDEFTAQSLVRQIQSEAIKYNGVLNIDVSPSLAAYLLSFQTQALQHIKDEYEVELDIQIDHKLLHKFVISRAEYRQNNEENTNSDNDRDSQQRNKKYNNKGKGKGKGKGKDRDYRQENDDARDNNKDNNKDNKRSHKRNANKSPNQNKQKDSKRTDEHFKHYDEYSSYSGDTEHDDNDENLNNAPQDNQADFALTNSNEDQLFNEASEKKTKAKKTSSKKAAAKKSTAKKASTKKTAAKKAKAKPAIDDSEE